MSITTVSCTSEQVDQFLKKVGEFQDDTDGITVFCAYNKTEDLPQTFLFIKSKEINGCILIDDVETLDWFIGRLMSCRPKMLEKPTVLEKA